MFFFRVAGAQQSAGGILEAVAQACPRAWSPAKGPGETSGGANRRLHVYPLLAERWRCEAQRDELGGNQSRGLPSLRPGSRRPWAPASRWK